MKKNFLSAFVALTFGLSTFANQITKDENFEFEEELVIDCYAYAESSLQRDIQATPGIWTQQLESAVFNMYYESCEESGLCTTCAKGVVVIGIRP